LNGIGLVVALRRELPAGFVCVTPRRRMKSCACAVYRFRPQASQHVAVQAGVGRLRAAKAARLLIRRFSHRALASFGFAGGLTLDLARGDLVIGTAVVEAVSGKLAAANSDLVEQFRSAAAAKGLPVRQGRLVTSGHVVASPTAKSALSLRSGACAVDMETTGIVEVAEEAGLPWVAVRAIVDSAEDSLPLDYLAMLHEDGSLALGRLIHTFCRSPQLLWHVFQLTRQTITARRHLSQAFECWTKNLTVQRAQQSE
jgi:adenosylhomocysteine nucleosidase